MIYWLYEYLLGQSLTLLPAHICIMIDEKDHEIAPAKLEQVVQWCIEIRSKVMQRKGEDKGKGMIRSLTIHVSTTRAREFWDRHREIRGIAGIAHLTVHCDDHSLSEGSGLEVLVAIGKSGREEICDAIRMMADEGMGPDEVCEKSLEEHLTFPYHPDLVIKTGGAHLRDFLIWQSVYSELFFLDVNWAWVRKVDIMRAFRDYQSRIRRFGR